MTPIFGYFIVGAMIVGLDYSWHWSKDYLLRSNGFSLNSKSIFSFVVVVLMNGFLWATAFFVALSILDK